VGYRRALPHTVEVSLFDVVRVHFLPVEFDPDELIRFWSALQNYDGDITANSVITLSHDMTWLTLPEAPTTLFVRKAYLDLVNIMFGSKPANKNRKYCITGTPGTGKTHFLYFLLYWCARNRRTVVVHLKGSPVYLVFNGDSGHADSLPNVPIRILKDPSTIILADAVTPMLAHGPIVMTTPPNEDIYKDFIRRGASFLYMPVWTLDELRSCKRLCHMRVTDEEIVARFNMSVSITNIWAIPCD